MNTNALTHIPNTPVFICIHACAQNLEQVLEELYKEVWLTVHHPDLAAAAAAAALLDAGAKARAKSKEHEVAPAQPEAPAWSRRLDQLRELIAEVAVDEVREGYLVTFARHAAALELPPVGRQVRT